MKESVSADISPYNIKSQVSILDNMNLSKEEMFLIWWKMDLITDDQACCFVHCSRMTLYNRWAKLKKKIVEEYNHEKV